MKTKKYNQVNCSMAANVSQKQIACRNKTGLLIKQTRMLYGFIMLLLLGSLNLNAQVANYGFSKSSINYAPISGTSISPANWDDYDIEEPIGFGFEFNCVYYTTCRINSNGYLTFGSTASGASNYYPLSSTIAYDGAASAFGMDLIGTSPIQYTTTGVAPNRIFTVQWSNIRRYNVTSDDISFQIRLLEGIGKKIEFIYGNCSAISTTLECQNGLRGLSNSDFKNRTSTTDWNATTNGLINTASITNSNTIMPASGLKFTWTTGCIHVVQQIDFCTQLSDDYSDASLWTQVGSTVNVNASNSSRVNFNHIPGFADERVYRTMSNNLGDSWNSEFQFYADEANNDAANFGVAVNLFSLTSNQDAPYRVWPQPASGPWYAASQSILNVSLESSSGAHPNYQQLTKIFVGGKCAAWQPSAGASSMPTLAQMDLPQWNKIYYVRLEQLNSTAGLISVFTDAARTIHIPGSPQCFAIDACITGLNTVQHSSIDEGGSGRRFTGWVDSTLVDTCYHTACNPAFTINESYCSGSTLYLNSAFKGAGFQSNWEITDNSTGNLIYAATGNTISEVLSSANWTPSHYFSVKHILNSACFSCDTTIDFWIYAKPSISVVTFNPATCGGLGGFSFLPSGGTPPYTISTKPCPIASYPCAFFNLTSGFSTPSKYNAGTYKIYITDAHGCSDSVSATITALTPPTIIATAIKPLCCGGNGGFRALISGGTGPYTVSLTTNTQPYQAVLFQQDNVIGSTYTNSAVIPAGNYLVCVEDANRCNACAEITIVDPPCIQITVDGITQPGCNSSTGGFRVSATGGTPYHPFHPIYNFTVRRLTGSTLSGSLITATGSPADPIYYEYVAQMTAGTYIITACDTNGCCKTDTFRLICGFPFAAGVNNTTCFNPSADATLSEPFPTGNYGATGSLLNSRWTWAYNNPPPAVNPNAFHFTRSLINFDLSTIPANSVTGATLQLSTCGTCIPYDVHRNVTATTDNSIKICKADNTTWTELGVNWNNAPNPLTVPAQVAIGPFADNSTIGAFGNVTGIVQDMVNNGNNGFVIRLNDETTNAYHSVNFASRENSNQALRPQLCVTYLIKNVAICAGTQITLTAQNVVGTTYKWYSLPGNVLIASTRTKAITPTKSGCYVVVATNACGCTATDTVCVTVNISVTVSSDTTICKGSCATLKATAVLAGSNGPAAYKWSTGETSSSVTKCPLVTTTYTVTVTDVNGCTAKASVKVTVKTVPAKPSVITGPVNCVCNGVFTYCITTSVGSTGGCPWTVPAGATILSGQGTNCITVSFSSSFVSGVISVACGNECGMSLVRTLTVYSRPPAPVITGPSTVCRNSTATYSAPTNCAVNYVWSPPVTNNGSHTSDIDLTFNNSTATSVQVCVSAVNACGLSSVQTCKTISITCRLEEDATLTNESLNAHPNPAHDQLNVTFGLAEDADYTLQLVDVTGRTVLTDKGKGTGEQVYTKIDVQELAKGTYVIQLITDQKTTQQRIIVE